MKTSIAAGLCIVSAFCFCIPLTGAAAPAETSAPPAAINVSDVVVTSTRSERLLKDSPSSISLLKADTLRLEEPVRVLTDAFENEPGIMVQKTGAAQGSPYIRGFTGYRNLFLIDGIRLNNSTFRDGPNQYWNTIDPLCLSRIEVARGTLSMLQGSDAIGGTVNAITRGISDIRPDREWDRHLYYRYGSAENSHIARAEAMGWLTTKLALTLGYSTKTFGDLEGGKDVGTQLKTGYDEQDWDAKLEYLVTDDTTLVLAHQNTTTDDAWRTHKTIYGIDWKDLTHGDELRRSLDQQRELTYLQLHHLRGDGLFEEVHAGVSYQRQSENQNRLRTRDRLDDQGFDVDTLGAFVSLKSPFKAGDFVYGADYYHDAVDSYNHTLNPDGSIKKSAIQGPLGDDATYDLLGTYVQYELPLTQRLMIIPGSRFEYARARANAVQDPLSGKKMSVADEWSDTVGGLRLLYALDAAGSWNLFGGISQGFRAPNLTDLTQLDSARTDEIQTPSPGLRPERFVSSEAGLRVQTTGLAAQLAFFYTTIDGMIISTPTGRMIGSEYEVTRKNGGDGQIHGIEFDTRFMLPGDLTAFGAFTWMDGTVETYPTSDAMLTKEPVSRLMPPTARIGLRRDVSRNLWIEGTCKMAAKADKLSTGDKADTSRVPPGGTPGYAVYDLRAGWQCLETLKLTLALENLLDEDYRIHGSGVNEPGRNLVLAADWVF